MRRLPRLVAFVTALLLAAFAFAAAASAHVTVTAPGATRGGSDQEITFRVPVEKTVDTTGLTVALPASTPIATVLVEPVAGWTHTQQSMKLAKPIVTDDGTITTAVSQITWKASPGHGLAPGEFGAFTIIAGQLPNAPSITFRALQRYADGSTVAWNEVAAPGSTDEPDNPAPVLTLAAATTPTAVTSSTPNTAPKVQAESTSSSSDTGAVVLAIVALVLAAAALGTAVVGRVRRSS